MKKVLTYGSFDLLHYGHINILKRAKALGDYLIVGVTSDAYDTMRGKINNQQTLMERIEAVRKTGYADQIIVEEYEGQKIDDIKKYDVDILTVGDDWEGKFDNLKKYCEVIYLPRTQGVSSTELRSENRSFRMKFDGIQGLMNKYKKESEYVNGLILDKDNYDALFIFNNPKKHYADIKEALENNKHVICESPIALNVEQYHELRQLAKDKKLVLTDAIKTAYSTAYNRMLVLINSGKIGKILSVDATCTSLSDLDNPDSIEKWNSMCAWAPTALLPVFQILGTDYLESNIITYLINKDTLFDGFTKVDFRYEDATASIKIGKAAKSEGELVITGTKGYIYVPSPWWKTDYFEVRYEDWNKNEKYFYKLNGEGIRNELVAFTKSIEANKDFSNVSEEISEAIVKVVDKFYKKDFKEIL